MRSTIKQLLFYTMFLLGTWVNIQAQVFPITVNAQVNNPPAIYLSNYADATTINGPLQLQLLLSDLSITNRQLQLKVYFEGNGFQLESAPVVSGAPPIFIDGGTPLNLGSFELGAYFELRNLTGISPNAYATSIPEGSYQFCFEVFDFITGNRLSSKTCTTTYIFQNEPPFLVLPTEATEIDASLPQNILFQWTPRHINVTNVEYELSIVEVWDYQVDPQTAFLSSPPVYTEKVTNTRLLYGPSKPLLLENKRYAWRVQAIAKQGAEDIGLFKNNGYSEISYFDFRMPCTSPLNISTEVKGIYKTNIYWDEATGDTNSYLVRYREANNPDAEWFTTRTSENWTTLWDLKEATTYEYQISSECVLGSSNFSQSDTFTTQTAEDEDSYYNCGISPDITLSNTEPISELLVGETFKAGDFPVKVTEISGSSGRYTGKGRVNIPYLKNIGVSVKFTNILVNTDKALADGMVVTTYDPTMGNIVDVDEVIDEINNIIDTVEDIGDIIGGGDHIVTEVDFEIDPEKTVVEDDKIIITGTNGEVKEIDRDEEDTYEIVGNEKVYRVDKEGNLTEVGAAAEGGSATAANTTGVSNGPTSNGNGSLVTQLATNDVEITFNSGKGVYGFDTAESDYEKEIYPKTTDAAGNNVYPVHKAVVNNFTDTFEATVTIKNESIKIEDLIFKTLSGKKIETEATGNTIEITVTGADGYRQEEVIVTYPKEDETQVVVGNFFLHHLAMHSPIKLGIVSINGASTSGVSNTIKEIYKTAGVEFQVTDTINFDITGLDWDKDNNQQITYDGSGKFTNYPSELISIFKGFKEAKSDTYYIFVTDIPTSNPLGGFMPKGSQFGFVFSTGSGDEAKDSKGATAAHELGHGIFSLRHPFEDSGSKTSGTDWLMDYGTGKELSQVDWAQIGSDALNLNVINIFQDDEDGALRAGMLKPLLEKLIDESKKIRETAYNYTCEIDFSEYATTTFPHYFITPKTIQLDSKTEIFITVTGVHFDNEQNNLNTYTINAESPNFESGDQTANSTSKQKYRLVFGSAKVGEADIIIDFLSKQDRDLYHKLILGETLNTDEVENICIENISSNHTNTYALSQILVSTETSKKCIRDALSPIDKCTGALEDLIKGGYKDAFISILNATGTYENGVVSGNTEENMRVVLDWVKDNFDLVYEAYKDTWNSDAVTPFHEAFLSLYNAYYFKAGDDFSREFTYDVSKSPGSIMYEEDSYLKMFVSDNILESDINSDLVSIKLKTGYEKRGRNSVIVSKDLSYDFLQPVDLAEYNDYDGRPVIVPSVVPASYLVLRDSKNSHKNFNSSVSLGVDIATTFVGGIGLVSKLRHLKKLNTLGKIVFAADVIALASGSANIAVKGGACHNLGYSDDECQKASDWIQILELSTLPISGIDLIAGKYLTKTNGIVKEDLTAYKKYLDDPSDVNLQSSRIAKELTKADDATDVISGVLEGARARVRATHGDDYVDIFLKQKYGDDQGAAAVIVDKYGDAGKRILDDIAINNLDDAAKAIVKDKDIMLFYDQHMYRAVNETSYNFDKLKSTGIIDASPEAYPTYISLDNFTDADKAKSVLQLPKKPTWVAEFTPDQVVGDLRFAKGSFNQGDYTEVLTQAYPKWGEGGGTQFLTNSEIKVSKLKNIETGQVIDFTKLRKAGDEVILDATKLGLDDATLKASKWLKPEEGFYDIVVHGTPDYFMIKTGNEWVSINHRTLASYMLKNGYKNGTPVRLVSCNSGQFPDAIAQHLSNKLGANVKAPSSYITVFEDGTYIIQNNGEWKNFIPTPIN